GEDGFPLMRVIDGRHATGIIDPVTNMLKEGYAILEFDEFDQQSLKRISWPVLRPTTKKAKSHTWSRMPLRIRCSCR
ncbi:hypothetical protein ACR77U_13775, partial [Enterococcus faecium]